jgi:hypothetical protein
MLLEKNPVVKLFKEDITIDNTVDAIHYIEKSN